MKTIWQNDIKQFDSLQSDIACDTAIIGGGIAGLWCAYKLCKAGQRVVILESSRLGSGVTSGSSAILTCGQDMVIEKILKKHGENVASKYLLDTSYAISNIKAIIGYEKIDCDLNEVDFVLYSTKRKGARDLSKLKKAFACLGERLAETDECGLPYPTTRALVFKNSAQLDPLKLIEGLVKSVLANGGNIYENTFVTSQPKDNKLNVNGFTVTANNFIVATHFPYINFPGFYFFKMYQSQNYSVVFEPYEQRFYNFALNTSYESVDKDGFEFRKADGGILCCGANVRTGKNHYKSNYRLVKNHIFDNFGSHKETVRFMAQDCMSADYLPYAGKYSNFLDNVYVLSGFNKWGMTNSFICSEVIANAILDSEFDLESNIYKPNRSNFFASIISTVENIGEDIAGWINNVAFFDNKKLSRIQIGQGAIVRHKGKRLGIYKDNDQKLHIISATCPHLGCALKWNKDENSWDCPCHGSRFDIDGKILNNPSIKNADKADL